jgi:glycine dehydrogenase
MLEVLGYQNLDALIDTVIPASIRTHEPLRIPEPKGESAALAELKAMMDQNKVYKSYLGQGYFGTVTPGVIQRNILENPGWYTAYTPYQAEIAQGRMEALLNFQTLICDLTGLDIANASLLDESTAAAEAMTLIYETRMNSSANKLFVAQDCHPQTLDVVRTRAVPLGIEVVVSDMSEFNPDSAYFGAILQYPSTDGALRSPKGVVQVMKQVGGKVAMATDLMALALLKSPGELGADVAFGSAQRFGVPLGFGGPHAAFFAVKDELKRHMPGRLIGVSHDKQGNPGLRLSLQTREQHIRRDKATSNICTAQVLLSVMAFSEPPQLKSICVCWIRKASAYRWMKVLRYAIL